MPNYIEVPDILYKGVKVYTLEASSPGVVTTPVPPSAPAPNAVLYSSIQLNSADNFWLTCMIPLYRIQLKSLAGSQQLYFDILIDSVGRRFSDGIPQPLNTVNNPVMKNFISNLINYGNYNMPQGFDPVAYTGPLRAVYNQLVLDKLAHKVP